MTTGPSAGRTSMVTPYADGTRLLHIGLPKTGTSTVQTALHEQRSALAEYRVVYAGRQRHSYQAAAAALGKARTWAPGDPAREWAQITRQMRTSTARCIVMSSEALSAARPRQVRRIVDEMGGDVQVLVTLRALAAIAGSNWQQGLRNQSTLALSDWLEDVFTKPPRTPKARVFQRRFDVAALLERWGSVVGEGALTFVIPDPADSGSLLASVEGLLGVPSGTLTTTRPANRSLPYPEAEFLRHFARVFEAEGGEHETWLRTVGSSWAKARIREMKTPLELHPIRVPRWAAERANELSLPWVDALRASGASVIGNPEDLLIDPAGLPPDVDVPVRMRIDAAAELALVLYESARRLPREAEVQDEDVPDDDHTASTGRVSLDGVPARELAVHLGGRALRRLRRP